MEQGAVVLYNIEALAAYSQSVVILVLQGIQPSGPLLNQNPGASGNHCPGSRVFHPLRYRKSIHSSSNVNGGISELYSLYPGLHRKYDIRCDRELLNCKMQS